MALMEIWGLPVSSSQTSWTLMPFCFRSSSASLMPLVMFSPMGASGPLMELMTPIFCAIRKGDSANAALRAKRCFRMAAPRQRRGCWMVLEILLAVSREIPILLPQHHGLAIQRRQVRGGEHVLFGPVLEHPPCLHQDHPLDLGQDLLDMVGHQQDGLSVAGDPLEHLQEMVPSHQVQF